MRGERDRTIQSHGLGPIGFYHFYLNGTRAELPANAIGDAECRLWTVQCTLNGVHIVGQGGSLFDALVDMSFNGLSPSGDLLLAMQSLNLPVEDRINLLAATKQRREFDLQNPQLVEILARIADAKAAAQLEMVHAAKAQKKEPTT